VTNLALTGWGCYSLYILKPIYYSQTITNDQYVKAVNILKGSGQDRVAFKFLVEECRMEWLQSIT
jgi:hypothetical protein